VLLIQAGCYKITCTSMCITFQASTVETTMDIMARHAEHRCPRIGHMMCIKNTWKRLLLSWMSMQSIT
jgi:hypothetical protein